MTEVQSWLRLLTGTMATATVCGCCQQSCVFLFRYRKWDLGANIKVVARCKLDAYMQTTMGEALVNIKACNEWDSKVCMSHICVHAHTHAHTRTPLESWHCCHCTYRSFDSLKWPV